MRLLELEIHNVRGIRNLVIKPKGKNFLIWGPNGSGKSGIVDAIDFLLTGRISRLMGKGTGDILLTKHGPHIDSKLEDTVVRAQIEVSGFESPIEIKRSLSRPSKLHCNKPLTPRLRAVFDMASRGQHVLTRRDILKYITAEARTRAQEIQDLMNISEVEDVREALVKVKNIFNRKVKSEIQNIDRATATVLSTTGYKKYDKTEILNYVNDNRAKLGGESIEHLKSSDLKVNLTPPLMNSETKGVTTTLIEKYIQNLLNVLEPQNKEQIEKIHLNLCSLLEEVRSNPVLLRALERQQLIQIGLKLIDETGSCPLCETSWLPGELQAYLEQQLAVAEKASGYDKKIIEFSRSLSETINTTLDSLKQVIAAAKTIECTNVLIPFQNWLTELKRLSNIFNDPANEYPEKMLDSKSVMYLFAPDSLDKLLSSVQKAVKEKCPKTTPEQSAWDTLTRLEENLKGIKSAEADLGNAMLSHNKSVILHDSFIKARDNVLSKLYGDIKSRFVELYIKLHSSDENAFTARFEPEEAGLNFEVDFYGRGSHPPHALHSEGHQDSMGVCLYLALTEHLTKDLIDLVIFDDVVMSIDAEHRRSVCRLLAESFPDRQFLITTHDRTWANQLITDAVVTSQGSIYFHNWHIDTGPQVNLETDMWEQIEKDLQKNDIPSAAARLRRNSEEYFAIVSDGLHAKVPFKLNGRWELGNFLPAAMSQYRILLRQAKNAAQSWSDQETFDMLKELDSTVGPVYSRTGAEQWAINTNVHYNNWATFEKEDFRPVVEAFQDLFSLFKCNKCGSILNLVDKGAIQTTIRCGCGSVDWNLIVKKK
ncbi:AAA family ATPase [candidate division KSB1 bacterium]